jgi:hypothetical protein
MGFLECARAVCHDVLAGFFKVKEGQLCPDDLHVRGPLATPFCEDLGDFCFCGKVTCVGLANAF